MPPSTGTGRAGKWQATQQLPAQRFELKAAECRQIADKAQGAESRQMYLQLARSYEEAAARENEQDDPGNKVRVPQQQTATSESP